MYGDSALDAGTLRWNARLANHDAWREGLIRAREKRQRDLEARVLREQARDLVRKDNRDPRIQAINYRIDRLAKQNEALDQQNFNLSHRLAAFLAKDYQKPAPMQFGDRVQGRDARGRFLPQGASLQQSVTVARYSNTLSERLDDLISDIRFRFFQYTTASKRSGLAIEKSIKELSDPKKMGFARGAGRVAALGLAGAITGATIAANLGYDFEDGGMAGGLLGAGFELADLIGFDNVWKGVKGVGKFVGRQGSRLLGGAGRLIGVGAGTAGGIAGGVLTSAYGMFSVFNRGSKGESFFGDSWKDFLDSRFMGYVLAVGGGAAAGALAGAPFAGVGAIPGAIIGAIAGLFGVSVSDFFDDVKAAVGRWFDGEMQKYYNIRDVVVNVWGKITTFFGSTADDLKGLYDKAQALSGGKLSWLFGAVGAAASGGASGLARYLVGSAGGGGSDTGTEAGRIIGGGGAAAAAPGGTGAAGGAAVGRAAGPGLPADASSLDRYISFVAGGESGNSYTAENKQPGKGPGETGYGRYGIMPGTWEGIRRQNPQANLPPFIDRATGARPDAAAQDKVYGLMNEANRRMLNVGREPTYMDMRMASYFGAGGWNQLSKLSPDARFDGPEARAAFAASGGPGQDTVLQWNPNLRGKTIRQLQDHYRAESKRYGFDIDQTAPRFDQPQQAGAPSPTNAQGQSPTQWRGQPSVQNPPVPPPAPPVSAPAVRSFDPAVASPPVTEPPFASPPSAPPTEPSFASPPGQQSSVRPVKPTLDNTPLIPNDPAVLALAGYGNQGVV